MIEEAEIVKQYLKWALEERTCHKHPVVVVLKDIQGNYVMGWNGAGEDHYKCSRAGLPSGVGMELCPGIHAEIRGISNAEEHDIDLRGGTIYLNEWFPCAPCAEAVVNAGLSRLVTPDELYLDRENCVLLEKLQNQSYDFELAEKKIREAGIEIVVDPSIKLK